MVSHLVKNLDLVQYYDCLVIQTYARKEWVSFPSGHFAAAWLMDPAHVNDETAPWKQDVQTAYDVVEVVTVTE